MRNFQEEYEKRVTYIRNLVQKAGAKGIVFGNSGGKDSALVGILCKAACPNTIGVAMPCSVKRNFEQDTQDALALSAAYGIEMRTVDLSPVKQALLDALDGVATPNNNMLVNIAPRLRMTTVYAIAAAEGCLVAGTGNRSERYVGYFTKWGDGAHDFNPIADLTATEVFAFLRFLGAPRSIIDKAPSAALFDGQTDEGEMGVTYAELDAYLDGAPLADDKKAKVEKLHAQSEHKRQPIGTYKAD